MPERFESPTRFGMRMEPFSDLMPYRVVEILLVATLYDAFILEEDGQLTELMTQEMRGLGVDLSGTPRFTTASSGREGLAFLGEKIFDLVVTTARLPDMSLQTFAREARTVTPGLPVGVLALHAWELPLLEELRTSRTVAGHDAATGELEDLFER